MLYKNRRNHEVLFPRFSEYKPDNPVPVFQSGKFEILLGDYSISELINVKVHLTIHDSPRNNNNNLKRNEKIKRKIDSIRRYT